MPTLLRDVGMAPGCAMWAWHPAGALKLPEHHMPTLLRDVGMAPGLEEVGTNRQGAELFCETRGSGNFGKMQTVGKSALTAGRFRRISALLKQWPA